MEKFTVNKELCIGCELCANIAPEAFKMEEEFAVCYNGEGDNADEAMVNCPVGAIEKTI